MNLVWMYMDHDHIKKASRVFRHMDKDYNGIIVKKEFMDYLKTIDGWKEVNDRLKAKGATKDNYDRVWK